jgi:pyruvate/2-oxoacid:ferredoxin oxidoreductase alpha subunit
VATSGSAVSTAREVIDDFRSKGEKVGLLKLKLLRPFPVESCKQALKNIRKVAVIDRNICPGVGGIWAQELKSALYDLSPNERPTIFSFIAGLGGRDITPQTITEAFQITNENGYPQKKIYWLGL